MSIRIITWLMATDSAASLDPKVVTHGPVLFFFFPFNIKGIDRGSPRLIFCYDNHQKYFYWCFLQKKKELRGPGLDNAHSIKWNKKVNLCDAGAKTLLSFPCCRSGWPHTRLFQYKAYAADYRANEQWTDGGWRDGSENIQQISLCVCVRDKNVIMLF